MKMPTANTENNVKELAIVAERYGDGLVEFASKSRTSERNTKRLRRSATSISNNCKNIL